MRNKVIKTMMTKKKKIKNVKMTLIKKKKIDLTLKI